MRICLAGSPRRFGSIISVSPGVLMPMDARRPPAPPLTDLNVLIVSSLQRYRSAWWLPLFWCWVSFARSRRAARVFIFHLLAADRGVELLRAGQCKRNKS